MCIPQHTSVGHRTHKPHRFRLNTIAHSNRSRIGAHYTATLIANIKYQCASRICNGNKKKRKRRKSGYYQYVTHNSHMNVSTRTLILYTFPYFCVALPLGSVGVKIYSPHSATQKKNAHMLRHPSDICYGTKRSRAVPRGCMDELSYPARV